MSGRIEPTTDYLNQNQSEAGPEVALFSNGHSHNLNFGENVNPIETYDSRTITKQSLSRLQINSKFGTFTRKACESIEKFQEFPTTDNNEHNTSQTPVEPLKVSDRSLSPTRSTKVSLARKPSALVSPMVVSDSQVNADSQTESTLLIDAKMHDEQVSSLQDELDQVKGQLSETYSERDQAISALRAYEQLLQKINEANTKAKRASTSSLGSAGSSGAGASALPGSSTATGAQDGEKLRKKNQMLERTVDNLEQTVQDTMARMNEVKDVNQELRNVCTDQQDMLAQYKSTIEQKTFEYRDVLAKHDAHIEALVTEHKRDRALLEKQITLLRAEAHMKSLDNERLASECRIKGEQLARMNEMLNELRQSY